MPHAGRIVIGGLPIPDSLSYVFTSNSGNDFPLVHTAPVGTKIGDLMVLTLTGYSLDGAQGADGSITPDPAWANVALEIDPGSTRQQFHVYSKIADAGDAGGTSSYTWSFATGTAGTRGGIVCFTIPRRYGTTLSAPSAQTARDTAAFSVPPPSGRWLLAMFLYKDHRASGGDAANPTITTTGAVELIDQSFSEQVGWHTVWTVPAGVGSVTGTQSAVDQPSASLIVCGVTA